MTAELQHLPALTPDQANVVVAMLDTDASLLEAAGAAGLPLANFVDLLESPEVRAHLDAIERAACRRARTRLADAAQNAVNVLDRIARDEESDKTERRRAATTILRALAPRLVPANARRQTQDRHRAHLADDVDLRRLAATLESLQAEPAPRPRAEAAPQPPRQPTPNTAAQAPRDTPRSEPACAPLPTGPRTTDAGDHPARPPADRPTTPPRAPRRSAITPPATHPHERAPP